MAEIGPGPRPRGASRAPSNPLGGRTPSAGELGGTRFDPPRSVRVWRGAGRGGRGGEAWPGLGDDGDFRLGRKDARRDDDRDTAATAGGGARMKRRSDRRQSPRRQRRTNR